MTKFTEIPWFALENYITDVLNPSEGSVYDHSNGGTLLSPNSTLLSSNTNPIQLYAKGDNTDYKSIKANITSIWNEKEDSIKLKRLLSYDVSPSDTILRTVSTSGNGYYNITYDYFTDTYMYDINNSDKIYARKDGVFHNWLDTNWDTYTGFLNKNKLFLYLGEGYKDDKYITIIHYALKDWMKNALPDNNRNTILDDFFFLIYDKLYHQIYETQKNIWSLVDPYEIDVNKISNLSEYYDEKPLSTDINIYKRRVYIDNLIYWLKKKGTYSSLFIIWYILTKDTGNNLKIYDRWHSPSPSGSLVNSFIDYDYTESYGGVYPSTYSMSDKVMSTHYKVEFEFDNNPFNTTVLSESLANDLYEKWESIRPVTRFSHYHMKGTINSDFSGNYVSLWDNPIYDANINTASTLFTEEVSGSAIHIQTAPKLIWTVSHDLDTSDVLVHIYDLALNRMIPKNIEVYNKSTIRIYFTNKTSGSVFITKSDYKRTQGFILDDWTISHLLNNQYILSQFYQDTYLRQAKTITATDSNTLDMASEGLSGYVVIAESSYLHTQTTVSNTWTITHNLGYVGIMLDVYDGNDEKINPDEISLTDSNSCQLTFSDPVSGYCGILPVGNPSVGDIVGKFDGIWQVKLGNGENLDTWDYVNENDIKNSFYTLSTSGNVITNDDGITLNFSIPQNVYGNITEIGIFNDIGELSWVSKIDTIYKHKYIIMDVTYYAQYENL